MGHVAERPRKGPARSRPTSGRPPGHDVAVAILDDTALGTGAGSRSDSGNFSTGALETHAGAQPRVQTASTIRLCCVLTSLNGTNGSQSAPYSSHTITRPRRDWHQAASSPKSISLKG